MIVGACAFGFGASTNRPRFVLAAVDDPSSTRPVSGFHARVVQHECDHLVGKLYPMRVRDFSRFGYTDVLFPGISAVEDD